MNTNRNRKMCNYAHSHTQLTAQTIKLQNGEKFIEYYEKNNSDRRIDTFKNEQYTTSGKDYR